MIFACEPAEQANPEGNTASTESGAQGGAGTGGGPDSGDTANAGAPVANETRADAALQTSSDGGTTSPRPSDAGTSATSSDARVPVASSDGGTRASSDASSQRPDWEGLVTLDASITTAPDGAVLTGGFPHYDAASAGPVLNAQAQAACLTLANNVCSRSADCQISLTQLPATQRNQLVASCQDTFLRLHNCNRATSTASGFNTCAEGVKTRDCLTVFANDFATSCLDQITFQP